MIFLQTINQNECLVLCLKAPIYIGLKPKVQGHGMTLMCAILAQVFLILPHMEANKQFIISIAKASSQPYMLFP